MAAEVEICLLLSPGSRRTFRLSFNIGIYFNHAPLQTKSASV